jgi:hypothetical protein
MLEYVLQGAPAAAQAQPDELKSVLAAARQSGWSFEKRADGTMHMVPLTVWTAQARPVVNQQLTTEPSAQDREDASCQN